MLKGLRIMVNFFVMFLLPFGINGQLKAEINCADQSFVMSEMCRQESLGWDRVKEAKERWSQMSPRERQIRQAVSDELDKINPNSIPTYSWDYALHLARLVGADGEQETSWVSEQLNIRINLRTIENKNREFYRNSLKGFGHSNHAMPPAPDHLSQYQAPLSVIPPNFGPDQGKFGQYPQASDRPVEDYELATLPCHELRIMRNEIFARHGYIFKTADMRAHFATQTWYKPVLDRVDHLLTSTELSNIDRIKNKERNCRG